MIYIHPVGGLGNMFFHIASIWTLAKDNHDELCLLNIDKKIYDLDNDIRWNSKHAIKYKYIFNRMKCVNGNISQKLKYPYQYTPLTYKKECEYVGYFQTEKYFKHRRKEILELFKPADEFFNSINQYSHLFNNIGLHVRRGDYVTRYSKTHTPQPMEYYNHAISILPKDMKILVFSDDLKWCRENFIGERFVFMEEVDYISIYLMSKMKYNIIASSFSWWGAWLSEDNEKMVITPKKWVSDNVCDTKDLMPENWIKI